jgi:hypothetical protein
VLTSATHARVLLWLALTASALGALALSPATPFAAGALPDGRAYEMVSPAAKNGGDVMAATTRTRAAVSGNAINFTSLTSFGDPLGAGIASEYISKREGLAGTSGWSAHSIMPRLKPLSFAAAGSSKDFTYQFFTPDLSQGVVHSFTPLVDVGPNVADVSNLFLRTNVLTPGAGAYQLMTDAPAPLSDPSGNGYRPAVADATDDFGHIIFEATRNLTADSPPQAGFVCLFIGINCRTRLYEWDHGTVRLAGILPDGSAASQSIAGPSVVQRHYPLNTLSDDGRRIFFTVPTLAGAISGALYMRLDNGQPGAETIQINASERTDCADVDPCSGTPAPDPAGSLPAIYQTASTDGSRVFFRTDEQLVDDDTDADADVYMYDTTLPDTDSHNLTLITPPSGEPLFGVVGGASDDGHYVYIMSVTGSGNFGIDAWHDGTLTRVGEVPSPTSLTLGLGSTWNIETMVTRVSPDGKSLLFSSESGAGLNGDDHGSCPAGELPGCAEVYLYRADTDTLTCVSCNPDGTPPTTDATYIARTGTSASGTGTYLNHPVSSDGNRVFFETGEPLVPEDLNGKKFDVYEYDVPSGTLHLISSGASDDDSHFLDATPSGNDVFFTTNERLLRWDNDNSYDLYDARVGGGFPEPPPAAAPECTDDACRGELVSPPPASKPKSSTNFHGSDNVHGKVKKAKKKCAKGKVRKRVKGKVKCVKRHRHRR